MNDTKSTAPTAATFAAGLRDLATLIDKHPGLAKDLHGSGPRAFLQYNYNIDQRAQLTRWVQAAKKLGATVSEAESRSAGEFELHLDFGSLRVTLYASREKVVVGTETVDKVEWRCPALLDAAESRVDETTLAGVS